MTTRLLLLCVLALGPGCAHVRADSDLDPALLLQAGADAARLRCNRDNRWGAVLRQDSIDGAGDMMAAVTPVLAPQPQEALDALRHRLQGLLFWRMVRAVILEGDTNNLGAFALRGRTYVDSTGQRRQVVVFRSGLTPRPESPESCFRSLLEAGRVRHVVNLFDGEIPAADLVAGESRTAAAAGATYHTASDDPSAYGPWRDTLRKHYDDAQLRAQVMRNVARLIKEQILSPGGAPPRGNIHIHCGGGMHRSGMISGIIERCVNGEPPAVFEAHYRYHVGYRDAAHPGGLEEGNLRFIRNFDCGLLAQ